MQPRDPNDPTLMRNQPALRTSKGLIWLVVGGLFALIVGGLLGSLALTLADTPQVIAGLGAATVIALYLAMIVLRLTLAPGTARLRGMAGCMLAMAAVGLIATWLSGFLQ